MPGAKNMSQMFFNNLPNNRNTAALFRAVAEPAPVPAPLLRMRSRTVTMNLGSIMTQNNTPCRACGH